MTCAPASRRLREDAARQLKDRKELYVDGQNVIRFGKHSFGVNTRDLELSVVPRDGEMWVSPFGN